MYTGLIFSLITSISLPSFPLSLSSSRPPSLSPSSLYSLSHTHTHALLHFHLLFCFTFFLLLFPLQYTNSDISQHQAPLQQLMNSGRGMMGGASPNDCVLIGDRLAQVQSSVDSLQRTALTRTKLLKDGLSNVSTIHVHVVYLPHFIACTCTHVTF